MIETARLILREWRDTDRLPFAAINADADVMQYLDGPMEKAQSDALVDRLISTQAEQGQCFWAIEQKSDAALLGFCGLRRGGHAGTPVTDELEIGWRLARNAWGHGFALEAAAVCLEWGWVNRDAPRIAAWTVPGNRASWGLMIRLGMHHRPDLDFDHPGFEKDHPLCRHLVYSIERPK